MATEQATSAQAGGQTATPGAGLTDAQLDAALKTELSELEQDPSSGSPWAAAFGPAAPRLNLGGGSGAGGYRFSPHELDAVISQWNSLLQRARSCDVQIHIIAAATSAASDEASMMFTGQAQGLGRNVQASHESLKAYAAAYLAKLQTAQRNYTSTEQSVTASLANQDGIARP